MKHLKLEVITEGIKGGRVKIEKKGSANLLISKDDYKLLEISVDTYEGRGDSYKERVGPFIRIKLSEDEVVFRGTVADLRKKLEKE